MGFKFSAMCLVMSWAFGVVGFFIGLAYEPSMFSRFGAIVVLFSVMSEYSLLKYELANVYRRLKGMGATVAGNMGIPDISPPTWHNVLGGLSHATIVIGTFIWGFGDLMLI